MPEPCPRQMDQDILAAHPRRLGALLSQARRAEVPAGEEGDALAEASRRDWSSTFALPRVEGYEVLGHLGQGSMGTVWRAKQLATGRVVAMKLMAGAGFASPRARARFEREVELTARLEHPNIARVYDSGIRHGVYFYAMEWIDGLPLDVYAREARPGREQVLRTLRLFHRICLAVGHAHERGVIHRDLKPANILVDARGEPHVVDFGLARAVADEESGALPAALSVTREGGVAGTVAYMSPEQAAGRAGAVGTRSDVYSLGVILYELLTGRLPHDSSGSVAQVMRRIEEGEPEPPTGVGAELSALLLKALAREPARRYGSAGELAADVGRYLAGEPLEARPPTLAYFVAKRVRRHRLPIALAAVAAAAVVAVLAVSAARVARERDLAVAARRLADAEALRARQSEQQEAAARAEAERQRGEAQASLGDSLVAQGDAMAQAGRWVEAKLLYARAAAALTAAGRSAFPAESGLSLGYAVAPPPLNVYPGHAAPVGAVALSDDARLVVSGDDAGTVRAFDALTARPLASLAGSSRVICLAVWHHSVLIGSADGLVRLWDVQSREVRRIFRHKHEVLAVCFSPDGGRAVSASVDQTCVVSDLAAGAAVCTFNAHAAWAASTVCFSADGRWCFSGGGDGCARLWDARTGAALLTFGPFDSTVQAVALSPDGRRAAIGLLPVISRPDGSAAAQQVLCLVDLTTVADAAEARADRARSAEARGDPLPPGPDPIPADRVPVRWLEGHHGSITRVAFTRDSRTALSAGDDGTLRGWDAATARPLFARWGDGELMRGAVFSADGRLALSGSGAASPESRQFAAHLWELGAPRSPLLIADHMGGVAGVAPLFGGRVLLTANGHFGTRAYDAETGRQVCGYAMPIAGRAPVLAVSPDGTRFLQGDGHAVRLWDAATGGSVLLGTHDDDVLSLTFSPDGRFALSHDGSQLACWDLAARRQLWLSRLDRVLVGPITFSRDGARAMAANTHGAVMAWDLAWRVWLPTPGYWNDHTPLNCGAVFPSPPFSGGAGAVALAGSGRDLVLWEPITGRRLQTLSGHGGAVFDVALSPDRRWAASGSDDGTARIWDLGGPGGAAGAAAPAAREVRTLSVGAPISCVGFSPDGTRLYAGGADGVLRVWDFGAAAHSRDLAARLARAREAVRQRGEDPAALLTLAEGWAEGGQNAWAIEVADRARSTGGEPPALMLARCHWRLGHLAEAKREFRRAAERHEAPAGYLGLCAAAVSGR